MFIERDQIDELSSYRNENQPVISLYLNVTPPRDYVAELNSMMHNERRRIADQFDKNRLKGVDQVIEKIEYYFRDAFGRPDNTRMVAVFADADGLWKEFPLPNAVTSQMVIEADTYTRPLTILLDEFDRYCVLVCDSRKARLFSLYLGAFEEQPDVFFEDNVPDRVRASGSRVVTSGNVQGGLGDDNIQSHIQDHIQRHLKNAADITFQAYKRKRFSRLIIGGPDTKVRQQLKNHLHSYLSRSLAAEFSASPDEKDDELRNKAMDAAREYERENEKSLISELYEKSGPEGLGVLGVDPVIDALKMGQVHTLIIDRDFQQAG